MSIGVIACVRHIVNTCNSFFSSWRCWPHRPADLLLARLHHPHDPGPLLATEQQKPEEIRLSLDKLLQTSTFKPHTQSILK